MEGTQYRLVSPYETNHMALNYVANDTSKAVLFAYDIHPRFHEKLFPIKLQGLDADRIYKVEEINLMPDILKRIDEKVDKLLVTENNNILEERLFENQDLCLFLKVTPCTLQRYRNLGLLPFKTICKRNYYRESDVKVFVNQYFGEKDKLTDKDKWQKKNTPKDNNSTQ